MMPCNRDMLGSRVSSSQKLLGEWKGNNYHKFQRGPFDLQLLPDQYTNLGDDNLPNKRKVGDHLKEAIYVNSQQDADFSDPLDLRLSLSLGVATGKKEDTRRSWYGKNSNTFPRIVIDLEESNERTSDEEAKHPPSDFVAKVADSGGKHDSEVTVISNPVTSRSMKKELCCGIAESSSFVMDSKCCIDWSCSDQGSKRLDNMAHENFLARKQQFKSYGVRHLDLNEVQLGDSSCHLNDAIAAHPSTTSLSGGFSELVSRSRKTLCPTAFGIKEIKFSNNNFEMLQQEDGVKLALMNSNSKDRRKDGQVRNSELNGKNACETSFVGLACISSTQTNLSQEHGSHHSNTQNGRDVLMPELQTDPAHGLNTARAVAMQVNCKKTEKGGTLLCSDKTQIIIEDEHPDQSPTSGKSSCISDNDSSPVRTMQSRIEPYDSNLPASDQFSGTHERSQVVETFSSELDQRSSDSNEMKHECNNNREESAEVDDLLQTAAESLIHLSLENPAFHHESSTKTESNELENEEQSFVYFCWKISAENTELKKMGSIAKKGLQKYLLQLQHHPLRTKAITAAVLSGISDTVSQKLSGIPKLQLRRILLKMLFGFAYLGPFGHYMYMLLDKIFKGKRDSKTVAKKVVLEQLTTSPCNNLLFMIYYGVVVEGRPWMHVKTRIKQEYPKVQMTAWTFWPVVGWINHQYVPLQFRVIFSSLVAFCWGIFLNLRARAMTLPKTALPKSN